MDAGISRELLIDKLHMLLIGAINEQDEGLLTDLVSAGMDIDAIAENMADGVIRLRKQEIKLIDERVKEVTIKRISEKLERAIASDKMPDRIFAWRYNENDIANDRVKCTTIPDTKAPKYLLATPAREHAEELREALNKIQNLAIEYNYGRSGIKYEIPPSVWECIRKILTVTSSES